jgi:uncharacterized protein DUF5916/cellulose/xylan binding protein with CBM9 domain
MSSLARTAASAILLAGAAPAVVRAQMRTDSASASPARVLPTAHARRASGTIRIDGRLDDAAWSAAPVTDAFTQIDPREGQPASQRTEVRVVYDDEALYVGVRLHDTGAITGRLGRRDMDLGDSDWFGLMIDSYHDHRTAFGFDVNPVGVRRDEVKTINADDGSWDAVWEVATSVDSAGWTAEYRVPFSQLRFTPARDQTWGIQFERIIGRNHEYAVSTFIPKRERGGVPQYGHLDGLTDIRPGKRLEVLPYTVSRAEYVDRGPNPFRTRHEYAASIGGDVRYRVTPNLTLNATINPDFGQVEVDPAVVNLGVYETFFDEKRPFFVEGSEIFAFGAGNTSATQLFYSRRIGRAPSLAPPTDTADIPDVTTILGAGKLSGKPGGWSIGVLEAVTAREESRYLDAAHRERDAVAEPLTNFLVARARRDLRGGQSFVGGIVSAVNRRLDDDLAADALRSAAYASGIDFRHEWANRSWVVYGDAELSRVEGSRHAITATQRQGNHFFQRPDAGHLDYDTTATSLDGYAMSATLEKQAGEHWRGSLAAALTSPGYEVNDLGFAQRTDRRDAQASVTYLENRPGTRIRNWELYGSARAERNYDWQPILSVGTVSGFAQTTGYWSFHASMQRYIRALDDRLTRGGPIAERPGWWETFGYVSTDGRKPVTGELSVGSSRFDSGSWTWSTSLGVGIKTSTSWRLSLSPRVSRTYQAAQFVMSTADASYAPTYGRRYLFAPLHQTEVGLETRFNIAFSPTLSLETYAQPLISSADYGATTYLVRPQSYAFRPFGGIDANQLDFNLRSLRGNAVLRWEWRQGSTLYVAWQQRRRGVAGVGDFDFTRDRKALFSTRPDNVLVLKVNYWMNP